MNTKLLGSFGEAQTAEYLRKQGCRILAMNYRTRFGEVDVIAADKRYIRFVEVKLRKSDRFAQGREFVTRSKQTKIIAAAQAWLQLHPADLQPRFDVMEIYAPNGPDPATIRYNYVENAFEL